MEFGQKKCQSYSRSFTVEQLNISHENVFEEFFKYDINDDYFTKIITKYDLDARFDAHLLRVLHPDQRVLFVKTYKKEFF